MIVCVTGTIFLIQSRACY